MGYKVLILEDNIVDAQLEKDFLLKSGEPFEEILLVNDKETFETALRTVNLDLILADYRLSDFDGLDATRMRNKYCRDVPLIIVSGTIGEEKAVEVIREGANDFLIKNESEKRLAQVSMRAIREAEEKKRRKEAEESLRKSEENYRLMTENSTDMISRHTSNGEFLYASPASYDIIGYKHEELLGTCLFDYIHHGDLENVEKFRSSVLETGNKQNVSYRFKCKDKGWLWVETTCKSFRHQESLDIYEIQASTRDITKNKEYEEKLSEEIDLNEKIINGLPGIFFIISKEGKIKRVNQKLNDLIDFSSNPDSHFKKSVTEKDKQKAQEAFNDAFEKGFAEAELTIETIDGRQIPFLVTGITGILKNEQFVIGIGTNIEERLRIEKELIKEKRFVERTINSLPGIFYVLDETLKFVLVNQNYIDSLGYSWNELKKMTPPDFYQEKDLERLEKAIEQAFTKGDAKLVSQVKTKKGDLPYYYLTGSHFREDGKNYILGTGVDITEQKKMEELLNQTQQMARIGAWEVDLLRDKINWTSVTKEIYEVEPDFVPDMETFMNFFKEGGQREKIQKAISDAIEHGTAWDLELQIITAKGHERWTRSIGKAECRNGKCIRLYGSFQDIHDRKVLQENLEAAQNIANLGYWTHDLEKDSSEWSSQMFNIWEVDPKTFMPGIENFLKTIHPEDKDPFSRDLSEAFPRKKYIDNEHRIITPDGKEKWILQRITLHRDENGLPKLLEGIAQDITSQKQKEEEIRKALKEKEILLMEIHHRVKNNLALISSILQLQAFQSKNEQVITQLMDSEGRIHSIATIHELLYESENFSQINLKSNILKLVEKISDSFNGMTDVHYQLNLEDIVVNVNQAIPCALIVNEVLTNIYKHAFINYKQGKVEIQLFRDGEQVSINVLDNGKGLPEGFEIEKQNSLGSKLITTLSDQLNAKVSLYSDSGFTIFKFRFTPADIKGAGSHFLK